MRFKIFSLFFSLLYFNHKVLSIPITEEITSTSFDSDSEEVLDIEVNGEEVTMVDVSSDEENITTAVVNFKPEKECLTEECLETSKRILNDMNTSVNPCDDFFQFTCGGFLSSGSYFSSIERQLSEINKEIYELLSSDYIVNEKLSKEEQEYDKKLFDKVKSVYNACITNNQDLNEGNEYLVDLINYLDIYETMEGDNDIDKFTNLIVKLENKGLNNPVFNFKSHYDSNDNDITKHRLKVNFEKLLFETHETHVIFSMTEEYPEIKLIFKELIKNHFIVVNQNEKDIEEKTEIVYEIIQKLYDIYKLSNNNYDEDNEDNMLSKSNLNTLSKKYSFINWELYFKKNIEFYGIKNLNFDNIIFYDEYKNYYEGMINYYKELDIKKLATYVEWIILFNFSRASPDIVSAQNEFGNKVLNISGSDESIDNINENEYPDDEYPDDYKYPNDEYPNEYKYPDDEYPSDYQENISENYNINNNNDDNIESCVDKIKTYMPLALAKYYSDRKFSENTRKEVKQIIEYLKEVMLEKIPKIDWLDEETKNNAIKKVLKMKDLIGLPEELNNSKLLYEKYQDINVNNNYLNSEFFYNSLEMGQFFENLTDDPILYLLDYNGYYGFLENTIKLTLGLLHSPTYSSNEQDYLNYGSLGTILGHELTHAFDSIGRNYDEYGKENNWWTDNDDKDFIEKSQCFIDQYNAFTYSAEGDTYHIDGKETLSENLADNGGISRAYEAWQKSMSKNPEKAAQRNQKLPNLTEYTLDQMFYIAYGQSNCGDVLLNDVHSPSEARVNLVLSNSEHFAKTFNCPVGSPMNPKNKCLLW